MESKVYITDYFSLQMLQRDKMQNVKLIFCPFSLEQIKRNLSEDREEGKEIISAIRSVEIAKIISTDLGEEFHQSPIIFSLREREDDWAYVAMELWPGRFEWWCVGYSRDI